MKALPSQAKDSASLATSAPFELENIGDGDICAPAGQLDRDNARCYAPSKPPYQDNITATRIDGR